MNKSLGRAALCAALLGDGLATVAQPHYRVTRMGFQSVRTMGNDGTAAGGHPGHAWHPDYGSVTIPDPFGGGDTSVEGGNDTGSVVGWYDVPGESRKAFLWNRASGARGLGEIPLQDRAYGVNDRLQVVGDYYSIQGVAEAWSWTPGGGLRVLPRPPGTVGALAYRVNNAGTVMGYVGVGNGMPLTAVLWRADDTLVELGFMGNQTQTDPRGLSETGWVTGITFGSLGDQAFAWNERDGFIHIQNPVVAGWATIGNDINDKNVATGFMNVPGGVAGYVWSPEFGTHDLNGLLEPGNAEYRVLQGNAISDNGQIACYGTFRGQPAGFLLTPVPEPSLLLGLPLALLAMRRRRRTH